MIKLLLFAITVSVIGVILKNSAKDFFIPFSICAAIIFAVYILSQTSVFLSEFISEINSLSVRTEALKSILKATAITVITKFSCDVCHESGNYLVEDIIAFGGRMMIFGVSLPYLTDVLNITLSFIK